MSLEKKINQRPGEEILLVVKRYALVYFWRYILGFGFLSASAYYLVWLLSQGIWGKSGLALGVFLGMYLIVHAWFFQKKNMLVVTSERVVDINRLGWFEEIISASPYSDIKDIYLHRKGMMASMFNYARIVIETKSQRAVLELSAVHNPEKVLAEIVEQSEKVQSGLGLANKEAVYKKFLHIIPQLSEAELCEVNDLVVDQLDRLEEAGSQVVFEVEN